MRHTGIKARSSALYGVAAALGLAIGWLSAAPAHAATGLTLAPSHAVQHGAVSGAQLGAAPIAEAVKFKSRRAHRGHRRAFGFKSYGGRHYRRGHRSDRFHRDGSRTHRSGVYARTPFFLGKTFVFKK